VPLTGAGFDEPEEPVSDDAPFDEDELDGDEPADAPHAVNISARVLKIVIVIIFFT